MKLLLQLTKDQLLFIAERFSAYFLAIEEIINTIDPELPSTPHTRENFQARSKKGLIEIILYWLRYNPIFDDVIYVQFDRTNDPLNKKCFEELIDYMCTYQKDEESRGTHLMLLVDCVEAKMIQKQRPLAQELSSMLRTALEGNAHLFREVDLMATNKRLSELL